MKAHRSTLAALATTAAERRVAYRVLRVARVVEERARVFRSYEKAATWLRARHPLLESAPRVARAGAEPGSAAGTSLRARLLLVPAERVAHRRQQLVLEFRLAARAEP